MILSYIYWCLLVSVGVCWCLLVSISCLQVELWPCQGVQVCVSCVNIPAQLIKLSGWWGNSHDQRGVNDLQCDDFIFTFLSLTLHSPCSTNNSTAAKLFRLRQKSSVLQSKVRDCFCTRNLFINLISSVSRAALDHLRTILSVASHSPQTDNFNFWFQVKCEVWQ